MITPEKYKEYWNKIKQQPGYMKVTVADTEPCYICWHCGSDIFLYQGPFFYISTAGGTNHNGININMSVYFCMDCWLNKVAGNEYIMTHG